jgi:hypothetical protein
LEEYGVTLEFEFGLQALLVLVGLQGLLYKS